MIWKILGLAMVINLLGAIGGEWLACAFVLILFGWWMVGVNRREIERARQRRAAIRVTVRR